MAKYFYRVDYIEGSEHSQFCGSSDLDPTAMMNELATAPFVRLDDIFFRDSQRRVRPWEEWDPLTEPTVIISCRYITAVMPFRGNPQDEFPGT